MNHKINLKVYWVTTVWPKGQIIIPKDSRNEIKFQAWKDYELVLIDKMALWLWMKNETTKKLKSNFNSLEHIWPVSLWSKFQFVIPVKIRQLLNINPWDALVVIWKSNEWLWFIKNDHIDFLFEYIRKNL